MSVRKRQPWSEPLAQAADLLADAVAEQWGLEARTLGLGRRPSLPVPWVSAGTHPADSWDALVRQATSGFHYPHDPASARNWANSWQDLASDGRDWSAERRLIRQIPTRRLLVLGAPGSGKSVFIIKLALDLLRDRQPGRSQQIPFLVWLASWNPVTHDLYSWLIDQMVKEHPFLMQPFSKFKGSPSLAAALVDDGFILPLLDGLDEIHETVQVHAIMRMNEAFSEALRTSPLVVTCRTEQYERTLDSQPSAGLFIRGAAAVQLRPPAADDISRFLTEGGGNPGWIPVVPYLSHPGPIRDALSLPLMASLASEIYNPLFLDEGHPPDPADLLAFASADELRSHLFDAYVPTLISRRRWQVPGGGIRAERWLRYLAAYLESRQTTDLAWWELQRAVPAFIAQMAGAALSGFGIHDDGDVQPRTPIPLWNVPFAIRRLPLRHQATMGAALGVGAGAMGALTGGIVGFVGGAITGLVAGIVCGFPQIVGRSADRM